MSPIGGIITVAKRYCLEQIDHQENYWSYHDPKTESSYPSSVPTRAALSRAVLADLERMMNEPFESIAACKERISGLAVSYEKEATSYKPERENLSLAQESSIVKSVLTLREAVQNFVSFINRIDDEQIKNAQPLPYKRRLPEGESKTIRTLLKERWQFEGFYWFPLEGECSKPLIVFDDWENNPYELVREIILKLAPQTIFQIQEDGEDFEVAVTEFDPNKSEILYIPKDFSWIIYASHEGTLTIGGDWLRAEVEKLLGDIIKPENRLE